MSGRRLLCFGILLFFLLLRQLLCPCNHVQLAGFFARTTLLPMQGQYPQNWDKYPYLGYCDIYKPHIVAHGVCRGVIFTQNLWRKYQTGYSPCHQGLSPHLDP